MGFFDSIKNFTLSNYDRYDRQRKSVIQPPSKPSLEDYIVQSGTPKEITQKSPEPSVYTGSYQNPPLDSYIAHYGRKRRSGPHPWGTGKVPYQHEPWFRGFGEGNGTISRLDGESDADYKARLDKYAKQKAEEYEYHFNHFAQDLRSAGMKDTDIAAAMGITTAQLAARVSISKAAYMADRQQTALKLKAENPDMSNKELGELMNVGESTFRSFLKDDYLTKSNVDINLAEQLRQRVADKKYVDIGEGEEHWAGVNDTTLDRAANILKEEGYVVETIAVPQATNPDQSTLVKVLAQPGETKRTIYANRGEIAGIQDFDLDENAATKFGLRYKPQSISSDRVFIKYGDVEYEDGATGTDRDGIIQIRRGVADLNLGDSAYAQVRIAVDDKHYLKGMAVYSDHMPEGYDVVFNTNKPKGTPFEKVVKPIEVNKVTGEIDWDNPFGATIKKDGQSTYTGKDGKEHVSAINKVNEEGDWSNWNKTTISSQMLSKQELTVAKEQMELTKKVKQSQLDEIMQISNPVLKEKLLVDYADGCDIAANELKAMSFPGQRTKVLVAIPSLKEDECYLPDLPTGTTVVGIRFPHGHPSEIPTMKVVNRNKQAEEALGKNPVDAVGVSPKALERLSGADSDGDTALIIPNDNGRIRPMAMLEELRGFDGKKEYPYHETTITDPKTGKTKTVGTKIMAKEAKQLEMGKIANLLQDMYNGGASDEEIARALKQSMIVIDAPKHKLDYTRSFVDLGIKELKDKYQDHGATSLISRKNSPTYINKRKEGAMVEDPKTGKKKLMYIDPNTGEKLYSDTGETKWDGTLKKQKVPLLSVTKDAYDIATDTPMDKAYADYHNWMLNQGNKARKLSLSVGSYEKDSNAEKAYAPEVASLKAKVVRAQKISPIERQAQIYANLVIEEKLKANPVLKKKGYEKEQSRLREQTIAGARMRLNKPDRSFEITDREWEAIEAHAVSPTMFKQVLKYGNDKDIKKKALPKQNSGLADSQVSAIKALLATGYSQQDIAEMYGISTSTVSNVKLGKIT